MNRLLAYTHGLVQCFPNLIHKVHSERDILYCKILFIYCYIISQSNTLCLKIAMLMCLALLSVTWAGLVGTAHVFSVLGHWVAPKMVTDWTHTETLLPGRRCGCLLGPQPELPAGSPACGLCWIRKGASWGVNAGYLEAVVTFYNFPRSHTCHFTAFLSFIKPLKLHGTTKMTPNSKGRG